MRRRSSISNAHPQYRVLSYSDFTEHRIENWHLARDGSGRIIRHDSWTLLDALLVALIAILWSMYTSNAQRGLLVAVALFYLYYKSTTVLWESVITIPPHGFQLETHTGFPHWPLRATRRFIPTVYLQDIIINEALCGWNVRYYLAFLMNVDNKEFSMHVAYKNIMPHFPILHKIYLRLHDSLIPLQPVLDNDTDQNVQIGPSTK